MDADLLEKWIGIGWLTLALVNAGLAQSKRRNGLLWFMLSLILGPFATLILVVATYGDFSPAQIERDIAALRESLGRLEMGASPKATVPDAAAVPADIEEAGGSIIDLLRRHPEWRHVPADVEEAGGSITCMQCGQMISEESKHCPACGWTWETVEK